MTWRRRALSAARPRRLLSRLLRVTVEGADAVPPEGSLIVTANHARRQVDPLILALAIPRPATFISARDLRRTPLVRLAAWLGNVLYVPPDLASLARFRRQCGEVLERGGALIVFPEGTGMGDGAGVFRDGAAYLALSGRASVSPAWIDRGERRRFTVRFGRPIAPPTGPVNRRTVSRLTEEIQTAILALRAPVG